MPIEYLEGIKPGQKIDLSRFEKSPRIEKERLLALFQQKLKATAAEYNRRFGGADWLDESGKVIMSGHPDPEADRELIAIQERQWAAECGKNIEKWKSDNEKDPAALTEMALTLCLQRVLPERFVVVRSSVFDDYNNGVDQYIIDTETGKVVCGVDEVIDREGNTGPSKKEEKIRDKMKSGGVNVRYGVRVVEGKLKFGSLSHIPAFYLSIHKEDLVKLGAALESDQPTAFEKVLLEDIRASLRAQARSYDSLPLTPAMKEELKHFTDALESWSA